MNNYTNEQNTSPRYPLPAGLYEEPAPARYSTYLDAVQHEIIEPIEAGGEAFAYEYDIEAIADEILGDHSAGYSCIVDDDDWAAITEKHRILTEEALVECLDEGVEVSRSDVLEVAILNLETFTRSDEFVDVLALLTATEDDDAYDEEEADRFLNRKHDPRREQFWAAVYKTHSVYFSSDEFSNTTAWVLPLTTLDQFAARKGITRGVLEDVLERYTKTL